ncbi:MAG: selenide, water dikinase SelD [Flavipsychrobacter sp.]|nr:selenide, water dikinase SelD [Flavipsychrobacter sp.]
MEPTEKIELLQYAHGAGCGCKIAPAVLEEILLGKTTLPGHSALLVGNSTNDDAAVYDMGNGTALISTTDFFMPIVNDPYDFGRVAAANAISDVYAMGGRPLMALAILGWPVDKLPASVARQVLDGGRAVCAEAGIPLAGGHSIDSPEPIFGLAVNGMAEIAHLKRNNTARAGDHILLTKPLGTGILSTAQKRAVLEDTHLELLIRQLTTLNKAGAELGAIDGVSAMTDVTGFGLLGHLVEMAEGSGLAAELYYARLPVMEGAREYLSRRIVPDATYRNWNAYSTKTGFDAGVNVMEAFSLLPDPQTNGGLLIAVSDAGLPAVQQVLGAYGLGAHAQPIGTFVAAADKIVQVRQ